MILENCRKSEECWCPDEEHTPGGTPMDVRIMSHTSIQILAQIRPDGNLHMIFLSQFRPDGAHTYRGTFGGPVACRRKAVPDLTYWIDDRTDELSRIESLLRWLGVVGNIIPDLFFWIDKTQYTPANTL